METNLKAKEINASAIIKIEGKEYVLDSCRVFANDNNEKDLVIYLQDQNENVIQVTFTKN